MIPFEIGFSSRGDQRIDTISETRWRNSWNTKTFRHCPHSADRFSTYTDTASWRRRNTGSIIEVHISTIIFYWLIPRIHFYDFEFRLLVNLTTPALLLYNEELPAEKVSRKYYLQIVEQLQEFKQAFAKQRLWDVLCDKLSALLKMVHI